MGSGLSVDAFYPFMKGGTCFDHVLRLRVRLRDIKNNGEVIGQWHR